MRRFAPTVQAAALFTCIALTFGALVWVLEHASEPEQPVLMLR